MWLKNPPEQYLKMISPIPEDVVFLKRLSARLDLGHVFCGSKSNLEKVIAQVLPRMEPDGVIWVSWPKKASKVETDITEDTVREVALPMGLVDIKVCAVDEIWSGLKLVIRKDLRK